MFLKSVKARGFKSFGRPVELAFEPGITVVVGPNGSGKSNIADAVMWVMGEQSPTAIRGANMRDFIFSGSDKLSPAGVAEVEITLDNGNGSMPIEFSEVSISRRLYREGEGAYLINQSPCRLTDVVELLADAGLGKNAHSIISQGKVDAILESRPQERRASIEEAAGLGKYKKRRHRAEVKLRAVTRNLERLADVEEEVRSNLRPLKRQATAAERSGKLSLKIASAQASLVRGRLGLLGSQLQDAEASSREAVAGRAEVEEKLSAASEQRHLTEEELAASIQSHKEMAARFYSAKSQLDGLGLKCSSMRQKQETIGESRRRLEARLDNLKGQCRRLAEELQQAERQRQNDMVSLEEIEAELAVRKAELKRIDDEITSRRLEVAEKARRAGELAAAMEKYRHQIGFLEQRREKLQKAVVTAAADLESHKRELDELQAETASGAREASGYKTGNERLLAALDDLKTRRERVESEHREVVAQLRRVDEDLKIAKARLTFIGDSYRDRSGLPPAAKKISEGHAVKSLIEMIEVEPGYERAVSAALGNMVFALAVRDLEHAHGLLKTVREGRLGSIEFILPLKGNAAVRRYDGGDYLLDHIKVSGDSAGRLAALLAGVRIVDDPAEIPDDGQGVWVTREGVVFDANKSLLSFKDDEPSSVVLKQHNERARLNKELLAIEARQEELKRREAALDEELSRTTREEQAAASEHAEALSRLRKKEDSLLEAQGRIRAIKQEVELKESVIGDYREELSGIEAELKVAGEGSREADEALAGMRGAGGDLNASDEALKAKRTEISGKVTGLEVEAARVRERERMADLTAVRADEEKGRIEGEITSAVKRLKADRRLEPVCEKLLDLMQRLQKVYKQAAAGLKEQLGEAETQSEKCSEALKVLARTEAELQQQLSRASSTCTECEVAAAKLRDQVDDQEARLSSLKGQHPEAGLDAVEAAAADEIEEVEEAIGRLHRQMELIGPVNPLAQKEYEEMLKRKEFLAEQRADLEKSLRELTGLIRELTAHIEASFNDTFEAVRRNFTEVVSNLFPGGEGRLTLVEPEPEVAPEAASVTSGSGTDAEPENPGEAADDDENEVAHASPAERQGIEISVKPPRKAVRNLTLLSGGERSLVAIAYLFAIFLAKPAPFYILDEVEAALDDINISRLLGMLRNYQDKTQFIVITHQKRTMEVADILYGVSMGSEGTSRVLSRKMPEAGGPQQAEPTAAPGRRKPAAVAG